MAAKPERTTCPRRMNEAGPWERKRGVDEWRSNTWTADREAALREKRGYEAKYPDSVAGLRVWDWPTDPPRTCSFCGSLHPDDAIRLKRQGWHVELTDKHYKLYMHTPGFKKWRDALHERRLRGESLKGLDCWDPTPCVKVYSPHFTDAQWRELHEL